MSDVNEELINESYQNIILSLEELLMSQEV